MAERLGPHSRHWAFLAIAALAAWSCESTPVAPLTPPVASAPALPDRNLFVYGLDDQGGLTPLPGSPFPSGGQIEDAEPLSAIRSAHLLVVGNNLNNSFSILKLDTARGEVLPIPGSPFQAEGMYPAETATSPEGMPGGPFVFVGNARSNTVSTFRLRSDGVPTRTGASPAPTGGDLIEGMAMHPSGKFLFVNNGNSNDVSVLQVSADGGLSLVPGSPFPGVFAPDEVVVHANGRFVFITNRAQATISVFAVAADGRLAGIPGSPFPAPPGFSTYEHCVLDSRGTLLFATFEAPPAIVAYRVGADGSLTLVPGTPILLGTPGSGGPEGMAVDPTDRFVYLTDHAANRLHVFRIGPEGALAPVFPGGVRIEAEPLDLVIPGWRVNGRLVMVVAARVP